MDGAMHFLHVVGALGLAAAFGAEAAGLLGLRRATGTDEALLWLRSRRWVLLIGPASIGLVLATGIYLTVADWGADAWILVSLVGGDGKFGTLLSVATYASVPSVILLSLVGIVVLRMQGPGALTSPQDMQPAVGLDLLMPGAKGFLGAVLKGINPFSIWGLVLTAIGISTTHKLSSGSGYVVATLTFVIGLVIGGALAAVFSGMGGG